MRIGLAVVLALSLSYPAVTSAGTIRPWLAGHGSIATYSMSDVNSDIGDINAAIVGTGLTMNEIHSGFGLGAMLGLDLSDRFSAGLGYDHLSASSEVGDATGSLTYDFPANAFRVFGQYSFTGVSASGGYLGASAGLIEEAGSVTAASTGAGSLKGNIEGTGGLLELFVGGDWWAAPQLAIYGSGGYRHAKIGEAKINGSILYLPNGQKEGIDYSGLLLRVGLKFAFTK
jgi:hypothetical protein